MPIIKHNARLTMSDCGKRGIKHEIIGMHSACFAPYVSRSLISNGFGYIKSLNCIDNAIFHLTWDFLLANSVQNSGFNVGGPAVL